MNLCLTWIEAWHTVHGEKDESYPKWVVAVAKLLSGIDCFYGVGRGVVPERVKACLLWYAGIGRERESAQSLASRMSDEEWADTLLMKCCAVIAGHYFNWTEEGPKKDPAFHSALQMEISKAILAGVEDIDSRPLIELLRSDRWFWNDKNNLPEIKPSDN